MSIKEKQSLYGIIASSIVDGQLPNGFSLPALHDNEGDICFADGAYDGICIYHMQPQEISEESYQVMTDAVNAASDRNFAKADDLFLKLSENNKAIAVIEPLQNFILANTDTLKAGNIYEYSVGVISISDNRECVKYALSMLELLKTNDEELKEVIKTLALSDEFTFFCIYIMKTWPNGNNDIFELAKRVHGWGRIHAVRELRALKPRYDEIRKWILEEGINNDVSPAYSALDCWKNGNIGSILYMGPTHEEFLSIRNVIDGLLDEGPVRGISTLDKKKEIIIKFLETTKKYPLVSEDYDVIYHIYKYFQEVIKIPEIVAMSKQILMGGGISVE